MVAGYYGCTGKHAEFTCATAFYVGPRKFKKQDAWCDWCRDHYKFPEGQ